MPVNIAVAQRSVDEAGEAFAHQFYGIVRNNPELVRRFYGKNNNVIPGLEVIIPDLHEGDVQIKKVYTKAAIRGGMLVIVRGHLTRKDGVCRSFNHSFLLASKHNGYYISNCIFSESEAQKARKGQFSESEAQKAPTFSCPICMNKLDKAFSTICGHVFCEECIRVSIETFKICPLCNRKLQMDNFHRVYLPGA